MSCRGCRERLGSPHQTRRSYNLVSSQRLLGRAAIEGESPVDERDKASGEYPEYHGARETLWESGGPTLQG